jgi:hypothetical protein
VLPLTQQIIRDAQTAKENSVSMAESTFATNIFYSVFSATGFLISIYLIWQWFRKRYIKKTFQQKPELT